MKLRLAFLVALTLLLTGARAAMQRPNILLILPDQMRASAMGFDGYGDVQTPNIAADVVMSNRTYANVPVCWPGAGHFAHRHVIVCCLVAASVGAAQQKPESRAAPLSVLSNLAQVLQLPPEESSRRYPVRLTGVITYAARGAFLQENDIGIWLERGTHPLRVGRRVTVTGITDKGTYGCRVMVETVHDLGPAALPPARPLTFDQLAAGEGHCARVEVRGIVRRIGYNQSEQKTEFHLAMPGGRLRLFMVGDFTRRQNLVDAEVVMRGGAGGRFNVFRQLVEPIVFANGIDDLVVEEPALDEEAISTVPVQSLRQFTPVALVGHRVKVDGVVVFAEKDRLCLRDESGALLVETQQTTELHPGHAVEVLGFPALGKVAPKLEDATFRVVAHGPAPAPHETSLKRLLTGQHDSDLVRLEAELVARFPAHDETLLLLWSSEGVFTANIRADAPDSQRIPDGSRVRVTGLNLVPDAGEGGHGGLQIVPRSIQLRRRSWQDLAVVALPPWWTPARLVTGLVLLLLAVAVALAWIGLLRRRIYAKTKIIEQKVTSELVWNERHRLARELHDTVAQQLAGVTMQLDTVAEELKDSTAAAAAPLELARKMLRHALKEVRDSVCELRFETRAEGDLAAAFRETADNFPARNKSRLDLAVDELPPDVPLAVKYNLLRIGQEAILNALKHAKPAAVRVEFACAPTEVVLRVTDDGRGFNGEVSAAQAEGHFGLRGMRERAERIGAEFQLRSQPGRGTTVEVHVQRRVFSPAEPARPVH